jgi:NAD(P)-dependent dehydrogenase (short-subunit alcohol dehydrogenase family)
MAKRTVLITGGGRRVGAGIAASLAERGYHIVIHYNASSAGAEQVRNDIRTAGGVCDIVRAELSDRVALAGLIGRVREIAGPVDTLINNASAFALDHLDTLDWELWDKHFAVNLAAPAFLCRDFAKQAEIEDGVIINIIDQKVDNLNPDFLSYTISKFGLKGLTQVLAMALAPRIRVCGISPGLTLISGRQTPESFERAFRSTPLKRGSTIEELARGVGFIIDTPSYSGQILTIDGGESLQRRARDVYFDTSEE